ncbi:Uu.00g026420.m01.CDS01 [Anthostomella pinea]|uniref:Uu.00g026420.m01.CDS01 n=1 Tax=Anthostomella pinea TaxID=933095 RepID=A0AAI8V7I0_9PEZI|nr:Uu.00g026420.m01.CDS01 [Anthostomella pinea]
MAVWMGLLEPQERINFTFSFHAKSSAIDMAFPGARGKSTKSLSIADHVSDCQTSFKALSDSTQVEGGVGWQDRGASTGNKLLDFRLRDASAIRNRVVGLLKDIKDLLLEGREIVQGAENESRDEPEGMLEPGGPLEYDDVGDLNETLSYIARLTTCEALVKRLGSAISKRRQYFKYREAHHEKLAAGLNLEEREGDGEGNGEGDGVTTLASSIPDALKDYIDSRPAFGFVDADERSESGISQTSRYQHHVGRHQEDLALFALPQAEYTTEESREDDELKPPGAFSDDDKNADEEREGGADDDGMSPWVYDSIPCDNLTSASLVEFLGKLFPDKEPRIEVNTATYCVA